MKKYVVLVFSILFILSFAFSIGYQSRELAKAEESSKEEQDYSKLFELKLYSDKQTYKTTDKIQIWATLKYVGSKKRITLYHGGSLIEFYISDGEAFHTGGVSNTILASSSLERDRLYRFNYAKSGGYSSDDPNYYFWEKFYSEKDLILPEGEYEVKASGIFSVNKEDIGASDISDKFNIKVEK